MSYELIKVDFLLKEKLLIHATKVENFEEINVLRHSFTLLMHFSTILGRSE